MRNYTSEESARYEFDLKRIELAWNNFGNQSVNGNAVAEPHPALAISQACVSILLDSGVEEGSQALSNMLSVGTTMFKFGQYCAVLCSYGTIRG